MNVGGSTVSTAGVLSGAAVATPSGATPSLSLRSTDTTNADPLAIYSLSSASTTLNTSNVLIETGNLTDIGSTGDTGDINLKTGTNAGAGARGSINLQGPINLQDGSEGTAGHVWTSTGINGEGNWAATGGANTSLSNLTNPTSINQNLIPDVNSFRDLGSASKRYRDIYTDELYVGANGLIDSVNTVPSGTPCDITVRSTTFNSNVGVYSNASTSNNPTGSVHIESGWAGFAAAVDTGDIEIQSGAINNVSGSGNTGNILIKTGTNAGSGARGSIQLQDGSEGTAGHVWTSTGVNGEGNWAAASGGSSSGINYIDNPDAETDTTGWNLFADAAGSQPVDGTGGAANITLTRVIIPTEVLRGNGTFEIAKDAVNRQGEGVSYDFQIDRADSENPKPIRISFDYKASANFAYGDFSDPATSPSDIVVYIYNKDGTQLIQPSPFSLDGSGQFVGEFQPAYQQDDYRLIFHIATTNASAWDFFFDNVQVGPSPRSLGPAMHDPIEFTPSFASGVTVGSGTFVEACYSRSGKWMKGNFQFVLGAGSDITGPITFNVPNNLNIDPSCLSANGTAILGQAMFLDSGTAFHDGIITRNANPNELVATPIDSSGATDRHTGTSGTVPFTWTTGDSVAVYFEIPIEGWSSNTQVSNDADTRVVAAKYSGTGGETVPTSTDFRVNFDTKEFDTHNAVTTGAGAWEFTCPVSGIYRVDGLAQLVAGTYSVNHRLGFALWKNGVVVENIAIDRAEDVGSINLVCSGSSTVQCNAGDTLYFTVNQNSGSNKTTDANLHVSIQRLSGPSQIAASETIAASAYLGSNQIINASTTTKVAYDTTDFDTHGMHDTVNDQFVIPAPGIYEVEANAYWTTTLTATDVQFVLYINGVADKELDRYATTGDRFSLTGSSLKKLQAGDTVDVRVFQNSAGSHSLNGSGITVSEFTIRRIGI
jgi:hypothetical protein